MKRMTQEQYNEWVVKMYMDFTHSSYVMKSCEDDRTIVVISRHGNKIGKATCHKDDSFNGRIGIAIAYARATGQEVPEVINKVRVDTLSYGDKFTYMDANYIFVAKHPKRPNVYITVLEKSGLTHNFLNYTLVEKI